MSTAIKPPTRELGQVAWDPVPGWSAFVEDDEFVNELRWPKSIRTYDRVRRDAQVAGLMRGMTLPIRRMRWMLDPNGARPDVVEDLAADLGLEVKGAEARPRPRTARRFSHDAHLAEVLKTLVYGHSFFEQVGEIVEGKWRLRKLAPRPQKTISKIDIARDGGLVSITQAFAIEAPAIPVSRLVAYVWDQEPGRWTGNSMLRELYRPWLLKDRVLRVGAINIERAGGVPYAVAPPGATEAEMAALHEAARAFRVGETAGGAIPFGAELKFAMAAGGDKAIEFVRLQNEEMSRGLLMMFMQLGQTETGSRSLGGDFIELAADVQETIAGWYAGTFNEHVIEDWVDWNVGPDEQAPLLVFEPHPDPELSVADLRDLVESGAIQVDDEIEGWIRARKGLPARTSPRAVEPPAPSEGGEVIPLRSAAARERRTPPVGSAATAHTLPERPLRRQPTDLEVRAAVDFAQMEQRFEGGRTTLVSDWASVRASQIDELVKAIGEIDPADLVALARVAATPAGAEVLTAAQITVIENAANAALAEAVAQGASIEAPDLTAARDRAGQRSEATADLLARSLSEAAGREAVRRSGSGSAEDLAAGVRGYLEALSDAYLAEQFGGLMARAEGEGRSAVFDQGADAYERWIASELLDRNTCSACAQWDGHEFATLDEAYAQYPGAGQNVDCQGGARCRGVLVGIFADDGQAFA